MDRNRIEAAIAHFRHENEQMAESIGYFEAGVMWSKVDGADDTAAVIADYRRLIARNEEVIAAYEAHLAQGT